MIDQLKALDAEFQELTGRPAFGYVSAPTPTSERWTFQDGTVLTQGPQAYAYMLGLLHLAKTAPDQLPYPLNQPLAAGQDLRPGIADDLVAKIVRAAAAGLLARGDWGTARILPASGGRRGEKLSREQVEAVSGLLKLEPGQSLYQLSDAGSQRFAELTR